MRNLEGILFEQHWMLWCCEDVKVKALCAIVALSL